MISLEQIHQKVTVAMPDAVVEWLDNPGPSSQHSLRVSTEDAIDVARFLRDDPELRFDYCSNVTGVDRLDTTIEETVATTEEVDGEEKTVKTKVVHSVPGYLEAVYHLYSTIHKHGPAIIRMRTANRDSDVRMPSLTPVWKSAEFQEREIYDLYGIEFTGHPDLRRLLMWDSFVGHPMRKDFLQADDDATELVAPSDSSSEESSRS